MVILLWQDGGGGGLARPGEKLLRLKRDCGEEEGGQD